MEGRGVVGGAVCRGVVGGGEGGGSANAVQLNAERTGSRLQGEPPGRGAQRARIVLSRVPASTYENETVGDEMPLIDMLQPSDKEAELLFDNTVRAMARRAT